MVLNIAGGLELNDDGRRILSRGGADGVSEDEMLMLEIIHRAPNMSIEAVQQVFLSLMEQYGEDALRAIRTGHVKFELAKDGIGHA